MTSWPQPKRFNGNRTTPSIDSTKQETILRVQCNGLHSEECPEQQLSIHVLQGNIESAMIQRCNMNLQVRRNIISSSLQSPDHGQTAHTQWHNTAAVIRAQSKRVNEDTVLRLLSQLMHSLDR